MMVPNASVSIKCQVYLTYSTKASGHDRLFAIAFAISLAFGSASISFKQDSLRLHLQKCFEEKYLLLFPSL